MKLIVGLGNPGEKYKNTRHNVGWRVLDTLALKISNTKLQITNEAQNSKFKTEKKFNAEIIKINDLILAKPQTFMNSSGVAVKSLTTFYKLPTANIYIIHDDLDIPLGKYKIQFGKGPELHYGVKSIEEELGTKEFWRVRVGIDNRDPENRIHGEIYTLQEFSEEEKIILGSIIQNIITEMVESF
jgi:peptidyl-tRNA hydrolase, PTH1 family